MASEINELKNVTNLNSYFKYLPNPHHLTVMHVNIRSLSKYFANLLQSINNVKSSLDIIVITEAGISDSVKKVYEIDGYRMYTNLRNYKKGGGIIVYVSSKLKFELINSCIPYCESIIGLIVHQCSEILLYALYRPPDWNKYIFTHELSNHLSLHSGLKDVILIGDININIRNHNGITDRYLNTLADMGLLCGITEYTRIELLKGKITKSCIDHIFCRFRTGDLCTAALHTTLADHRMIVLSCIGMRRTQGVSKVATKYDHTTLNRELNKIDWRDAEVMTSPIDIYKYIESSFLKCYEKSKITYLNSTKNIKEEWVTNKVIRSCHDRDKLFKECKKDLNNISLRLQYNKLRNKTNRIVNEARNNYYNKLIIDNKKDTKKLWQILNKISGRISQSVDDVIKKAFDSANEVTLANNFALSFDRSVKSILPTCSAPLLNQTSYSHKLNRSIYFKKATKKDVAKIIKNINPHKAPGCDKIRMIDINLLQEKLLGVISNLINTSIKTGIYPTNLKKGIVRPIYKKGAHNCYDNYRPITILPTVNKIVEKYVCRLITSFYESNNVLNGFRTKKNTSMLLSKFTDEINDHPDSKKHVLIVFIDYSKAFDTLRHCTLLQKLENTGIRGPLLNWCENYMKERSYVVKLGETHSHPISITVGTAQGSVLGPLHYLTHNKPNRYARLVAHSHDCLHTDQTNCTCEPIERVSQQTYLGLVIDDRLNWGSHIESLTNKLRAILARFYAIKTKVPYKILRNLYLALVESLISYGITSYGRTFKTYLNKIYSIQLRFLKLIVPKNVKLQHVGNYHDLFKFCKIIPIHQKVQYSLLTEQYYREDICIPIKHNKLTRKATSKKMNIFRANNIYGQRTSKYIIPRLINAIPTHVTEMINKNNIKRTLKKHYQTNLFM
ncbi:hypothetical protein ABMA27_014739 [Loxostege sticticalis]|uniref:Reverse transcriptase domain-containing protein n=1 Tax=Loxostege sticticalis TaxID=481309 RepID=A0ABR3IA18_LOXSC